MVTKGESHKDRGRGKVTKIGSHPVGAITYSGQGHFYSVAAWSGYIAQGVRSLKRGRSLVKDAFAGRRDGH